MPLLMPRKRGTPSRDDTRPSYGGWLIANTAALPNLVRLMNNVIVLTTSVCVFWEVGIRSNPFYLLGCTALVSVIVGRFTSMEPARAIPLDGIRCYQGPCDMRLPHINTHLISGISYLVSGQCRYLPKSQISNLHGPNIRCVLRPYWNEAGLHLHHPLQIFEKRRATHLTN